MDNQINQVRETLIQVAKGKKMISYSDLARKSGLNLFIPGHSDPNDSYKIGKILEEIGEEEHKNGRPLITVLVHHSNSSSIGDGFFRLCDNLNIVTPRNQREKEIFLIEQISSVHEYWGKYQAN